MKLKNIRKPTSGSKRKPKTNPSPKKNKGPKKPRKRAASIAGYEKCLTDFPPELRGPPQNRYGGHNTVHMRAFKDSSFGGAGPCRTYSARECAQVEQELRAKGYL
jgi:hypothetical protein